MVKINILLVSLFSIGCFTSCSSDSNANNNSELGYLVGDKRIIINDQVRMQKKLPIGLEGYYFDYNNEENTSAVVNRYAYAGEAQAENNFDIYK